MEQFLDTIIPKFWKCKQENKDLPPATPKDLPDSQNMKELSLEESSEEEALERFFANSASKREEALALLEALCEPSEPTDGAAQGDDALCLEDIVLFLKDFPEKRWELRQQIRGLHAVADQVEKTHRKCALTNVVAGSTSMFSGVMTILGLALAPVTAGGSLILSASGLGLGALATVTSLSSNVIERASNVMALERLSDQKGSKGRAAAAVLCKEAPRLVSATQKCVSLGNQAVEEISKNVRAFRLAKANPGLFAKAQKLTRVRRLFPWKSPKVEKAFSGTALAMTRGARVMGAMTAGALVLVDMITFIQDLNHLLEGAEAEMAGELREQAQKLQNKLEELSQAYNSLLDIMTSHGGGEGEAGEDAAASAQ